MTDNPDWTADHTDSDRTLAANTELLERTTELQLILDNMPCLMALLDDDCRYRFANREYLRAFDKTEESIQGLHVSDVMGLAGWETIEPFIRRVLAGERVNYEAAIPFADGPRYTQVSYTPNLGADGRVLGFYVFALDVHNRRVAEETLRRNEQLLRVTLDAIVDGMITVDENGLVRETNPVAAELLGRGIDEIKGQRCEDLFELLDAESRERLQPLRDPADHNFSSGRRVECLLKAQNGDECPVEVSVSPCHIESGEPFGWLIVVRDVTQERQMRERMRAGDRMSAMGQLAGGIAHDFNNLLSGVLGFAQLVELREGETMQPRSLEQLQAISQAARRAGRLSDRLTSFSRAGTQLHSKTDIRRVIHEVAGILAHTVDKRVRVDVSNVAMENSILGDAAELESSLLNVCLNAGQSMPEGGRLTIRTQNFRLADDTRVQRLDPHGLELGLEIQVSDEGVGIAPDDQLRIFDPFYTTKPTGVGLGLAVVQRVIGDHGGVIDVSSELDVGTVFRMRFPCLDSKSRSANERKVAFRSSNERLRILVVDDEARILEIAAEMLQALGHSVHSAKSGPDAMAIFDQRRGDIDLVILDINMPGMTGTQTLAELREVGATCPIVMSTGYADSDMLSASADFGISGVLKKPYDFEDLEVLLATLGDNTAETQVSELR